MVQFVAFWCILWPILAFITLLFLRLSFVEKYVAFDMLTSLKTKKKNLKCGFKSSTDLIQQAVLASKKKVQAGLELRASG